MKKGFLTRAFALLFVLTGMASAQAVVLDWSSATWAGGSLSNSYDVDPSHAGNDITVSISGNTANLLSGYPQVANDLTGGFTPADMALRLQLDLPNVTNSVTVTITFLNPLGVLNPTFSIYDIDVGTGTSTFTYQDQIRNIQASFGAVTYTPVITAVGADATVTGGNTITGNATAPNNSSAGNATVSFVGTVSQISFVYGSGTAVTGSNPAQQGIAISDISFNNISGVPEINSVWIALGALLLAGFVRSFRQNQANRLSTCASVE